MRDNYICLSVGVAVALFGGYIFYLAATTNDDGLGVLGFGIFSFGVFTSKVNIEAIKMGRGGKRKGAGGQKPLLPESEKRRKDTITLLPHEWDQLDEIGPSRGKAVSKLLSERTSR